MFSNAEALSWPWQKITPEIYLSESSSICSLIAGNILVSYYLQADLQLSTVEFSCLHLMRRTDPKDVLFRPAIDC